VLVKVLKFGSNWWARFGHDPGDQNRYTRHAAYFNSAGLRCGNKLNRHWIVPGLIRFNGVGDFNPQFPNRSVGATFECTDLVFALGGNRVLFQRKARISARAKDYLISVSSDVHGTFDFEDAGWKSESVTPIAISRLDARQEALLLMQSSTWVRSSLGIWQLNVAANLPLGLSLELLEHAEVN